MKNLFVLLCVLFIMFGCSKDEASNVKQVLEDETKPLRVLVDTTHSYASCRLENGEFAGTEIDLIKRLALRMNREILIEVVSFKNIIPAIKAGKADLGISRIIVTPSRLLEVDFSNCYGEGGNAFVYYRGEKRPRISRSMGDKIGTLKGGTGDLFLAGLRCMPIKFDSFKEAYDAFERKEVSSLFFYKDELEMFVNSKTNASEFVITPLETRESYSIAVAKNRKKLLLSLNEALAKEGKVE